MSYLMSVKINILQTEKHVTYKIKNHGNNINLLYDLFSGSGGLLDNAKWENESSKQSFDFVIANPPYHKGNTSHHE